MLSGPKEAAGESDIRPDSPSSMVMSLATMLLAFTTHVIVQEAERNAAILLDYLLDLLGLLSLGCTLGFHRLPKASTGLPNELSRIGHREDEVQFNVLAVTLVDSFSMLDASLIEEEVALCVSGLRNGDLGLLRRLIGLSVKRCKFDCSRLSTPFGLVDF